MRKHIFFGLFCCLLSGTINAASLEIPAPSAAAVVTSPCFLDAYVGNVTTDNFLHQMAIFTGPFIKIGELQYKIDVLTQDTSLDAGERAVSIRTFIEEQSERIRALGEPKPRSEEMEEDWLCPNVSPRDILIAKELYLIAKAEEPDAEGVMRKKYRTCASIGDAVWIALSSIIIGVEPEDIYFEDATHPVIATNPAQRRPVPQKLQAEINLWGFFMLIKQDASSHDPVVGSLETQALVFGDALKAYREAEAA